MNKPMRNIVGTPTNKRLATNPKLVVSISWVVLLINYDYRHISWNKVEKSTNFIN